MGATLNDKHTDEWGLIVEKITISPPKVKTRTIEVPYGFALDMTELDGNIHYKNREINIQLGGRKKKNEWPTFMSAFLNEYHGKIVKVIPDNDLGYYYFGRAEVPKDVEKIARIGKFTMTIDANPYKYDVQTSLEEWKWDPFNFEIDVIREMKDIEIKSSNTKIEIPGTGVGVVPIFDVSVSNNLTIVYSSKTYSLPVGKNRYPEIKIGKSTMNLTFQGTGTLSLDYRGRSL